MKDILYLAMRYLVHNRVKTVLLIGAIALVVFLPAGLHVLVEQSARRLTERADATPLLIGAKGSSLDLLMNTLYFGDEVPESIVMAVSDTVTDTDLAYPIPMYIRFKTRGLPIVGTSLDYFDFRMLPDAAIQCLFKTIEVGLLEPRTNTICKTIPKTQNPERARSFQTRMLVVTKSQAVVPQIKTELVGS